ncbi:hypothetical protein ACFL2G_03110 [Candidatus Omnitrophota bacterium]
MAKRFFVLLTAMCFVFLIAQPGAYAGRKGKAAKFKHADKNKDGMLNKKEIHMEKKWEERHKVKGQSKVNTWWEKHADTNSDGVVDGDESAAWKKLQRERIDLNGDGTIDAKEKRLCWRHGKSKVNTAMERKYDINSNGFLEPEEVKAMLKDKHLLVKTNGKAKVDSEIEQGYDTNNNGMIDKNEAKDMAEDLGQ